MILHGDCLEKLKELPENSIDSIVTDPPYGLSFMGKKWDYDVPSIEIWKECLRVLKPGGHLLAFGGTRTYHRMVVAIEDAGFEIRDQIQWIYGSGFPKSMDISKAIDKAAGAEREVVGHKDTYRKPQTPNGWDCTKRAEFETTPSTDSAKQWQGWGTALKPANEPIVLARKPLSESTIAKNVERWGTGGINIDECRISVSEDDPNHRQATGDNGNADSMFGVGNTKRPATLQQGRWPANLILDEVAAFMLDEQSGISKSTSNIRKNKASDTFGTFETNYRETNGHSDSGGASRFFYCAKSSKSERNAGLDGMPEKDAPKLSGGTFNSFQTNGGVSTITNTERKSANNHPTVKPIRLMEYLIKLVTPPKGTVLDPFAGSGTTLVAAKKLGFKFIGVEREIQYIEIIERRVSAAI